MGGWQSETVGDNWCFEDGARNQSLEPEKSPGWKAGNKYFLEPDATGFPETQSLKQVHGRGGKPRKAAC